jgi:hypothetical protein
MSDFSRRDSFSTPTTTPLKPALRMSSAKPSEKTSTKKRVEIDLSKNRTTQFTKDSVVQKQLMYELFFWSDIV